MGIGSDYDGGIENPTIPDVSKLVLFTQALLNRGFSEEEIRKIWGGKFSAHHQESR